MKQNNVQKRLDERRTDFHRMMAERKHDTGVQKRLDSGGYKCPGSNKK